MYTYGDLLDDVNYLSRYGAETGCIGMTRCGRMIPYVRLTGESGACVLVTAGIHAREHVSSLFAIKQVYKLFSVRLPWDVCFVPMVNPDGNVLVSDGAAAFGFAGKTLLAQNGGNPDFSMWKANAAGVDLNVNFDARWGQGAQNVREAGGENYIGECAFSEPETAALARFTKKVCPCLTLSYHAKGREIYYAFSQSDDLLARDYAIARRAAEITGYTLVEGTRGSAGGYKVWCIDALEIPSLTLELASDELRHPLSDDSIKEDFLRGGDLPVQLYAFMKEKGYVD